MNENLFEIYKRMSESRWNLTVATKTHQDLEDHFRSESLKAANILTGIPTKNLFQTNFSCGPSPSGFCIKYYKHCLFCREIR